jgi:hypothetical protein
VLSHGWSVVRRHTFGVVLAVEESFLLCATSLTTVPRFTVGFGISSPANAFDAATLNAAASAVMMKRRKLISRIVAGFAAFPHKNEVDPWAIPAFWEGTTSP